MSYQHIPVMLGKALEYLEPFAGGTYVDCTLGGAGYTLAIAQRAAPGQVLAIDLDELAIENAKREIRLREMRNITLVKDNFKNLLTIAAANGLGESSVDGIVMDLGLSSAQLADEARGFSFKGERPLDMAFGPGNLRSTEEILNSYPLPELTRVFRDYGEERQAYRIAKAVVARRQEQRLRTTADLVAVIERVVPFRFRSRIHPATRIFQALRMETNDELAVLGQALPGAVSLLRPGGRIVVVSFHSGEDRIVKNYFRSAREHLSIITKRPVRPDEQEAAANPRSRSAKLRAATKI